MKRSLCLSATLFFLLSGIFFNASAQENVMDYIHEHYEKQEVYITMRDGVRLFTSVYSPRDKSRKYPILMTRTPYDIEPEADKYSGRLANYIHLMKDGYIMVMQDVRGRYMSEGGFEDVRPYNPHKKKKETDENSDTWDTIDWLVKNVDNNNGKVGIYGISYPGFYSTMSLPAAHPALKAVSPQAPVTNWFLGDDWHHNGAFFIMDAFNFYSTFGRPRRALTRKRLNNFDYPVDDNYQFFMDIGPVKNVTEKYFGDTIQFWPGLMSHPDYDDFWKARNVLPHLTDVKPAVLVVGGWFDAEDLFGPLHTYAAIERQNPVNNCRLVMGPWSHGQWAGGNTTHLGNVYWGGNPAEHYKALERNFFNFYLKGEGEMEIPEASVYITGANEWAAFDTWPPKQVMKKQLFFHENGGLVFTPPSANDSYDEYVADPAKPVPYTEDVHLHRTREYMTDDQRFAARRPDVMVYSTEILTEDITLTGPVTVNLYVSTTGTDADYVVKLIDVFPDKVADYPKNEKGVPMGDYQMLVRGDVFRGRFRESFEKPVPFIPGEVSKVSFTLQDLAHTFKKGHKIMIQVQNSWFPLVDRNPQQFVDIYNCGEKDFIKATHRIYHDRDRPSGIEFLILGN